MKKFVIIFIVFVISCGFCFTSQAQETSNEKSNLLSGVIIKLENMRDNAIADIRKYESDIRKCDNTISKSQNIIQLAREQKNIEAEKIASDASIKAKGARIKNIERKNLAELNQKRIEFALANVKNKLSNALSQPQKIKSVITNYSGSVSIKKKDGKIIRFGNDQPPFLENGDEISTNENSSSELIFLEGRGNLKIGENSIVKMEEDTEGSQVLNMMRGKVNISVEKLENYQTMMEEKIDAYKEDLKTVKDEFKQKMVDEYDSRYKYLPNNKFKVRTPTVVVAIRATQFLVYEDDKMGTELIVFEGSVEMKGIKGEKTIIVNAGYKGTVTIDAILSDPQMIDLTKIDRWWE